MSFRIASYNALYPAYAEANKQKEGIDAKGKSNWYEVRRYDFAKNLFAMDADILLVQEMDSVTMSSLFNMQPAYWSYTTTHHYAKQELGRWDGVSMFYKYDRFRGAEGSKHTDVDYEYSVIGKSNIKKCVKHIYYDLQDSITKKIVRVMTCHLLSEDHSNSKQHLDAVLKTIDTAPAKYPIDAHVLAGDFNANEATERFKKMSEKFKFDGDLSGTEHATGKKKDWIWIKQQLESTGDSLLMQHVPITFPCPSASHRLPTVTECVFASSIAKKFAELEDADKVKSSQGPILAALLKDKEITNASGDSLGMLREAFQVKTGSLDKITKLQAVLRLDRALDALFQERISKQTDTKDRYKALQGMGSVSSKILSESSLDSFLSKFFKNFVLPQSLNSQREILDEVLHSALLNADKSLKENPGYNFEAVTRKELLNNKVISTLSPLAVGEFMEAFKTAWNKAENRFTVKKGGCCEWLLNIFRAIARFFQRICCKSSALNK